MFLRAYNKQIITTLRTICSIFNLAEFVGMWKKNTTICTLVLQKNAAQFEPEFEINLCYPQLQLQANLFYIHGLCAPGTPINKRIYNVFISVVITQRDWPLQFTCYQKWCPWNVVVLKPSCNFSLWNSYRFTLYIL